MLANLRSYFHHEDHGDNQTVSTTSSNCPNVVEEEATTLTNCFYDFIDPNLRMQFYTFNTHHSTSTIFFTQLSLLLFLVIICPAAVLNTLIDISVDRTVDNHFGVRLFVSFCGLLSALSCCYCAVAIYVMEKNARMESSSSCCPSIAQLAFTKKVTCNGCYGCHDLAQKVDYSSLPGNSSSTSSQQYRQRRIRLVMQMLFSIQVYSIVVFIRRSFSLNCPISMLASGSSVIENILRALGAGQCYSSEYQGLLLYMNSALALLYPIFFYIGFPETPIVFVWGNFTTTVLVTIISTFVILLGSKCGSYPVIGMVFNFLLAFMAIREMHIRNLRAFLMNQRLVDALKETRRLNEENRQTEMKYTLANVTHDLKSVSGINTASYCYSNNSLITFL